MRRQLVVVLERNLALIGIDTMIAVYRTLDDAVRARS